MTINDSANAIKSFKKPSKKTITTNPPVDDNPEEVDLMEPKDTAMIDAPEAIPVTVTNPITYRFILPEIWIIISRHIRPEDVARFAGICRTTYNITRRAQFWFHMYAKHGPVKRSYGGTELDNLPQRLQPESMVRLGGLRACVIRTLFYTYRPFVDRLEHLNRNLDLTSFTRRLKIKHMWCMKAKHWCYSFHLQAPVPTSSSDNNRSSTRASDRFIDVLENVDEGCRILALESPKYVPLPHTFDQSQQIYLKAVTYTMSFGLRNYKVNMELVNYNGTPLTKLVFDPAHNIKVWDWWHPNYYQIKNYQPKPQQQPVEEDFYFDHF